MSITAKHKRRKVKQTQSLNGSLQNIFNDTSCYSKSFIWKLKFCHSTENPISVGFFHLPGSFECACTCLCRTWFVSFSQKSVLFACLWPIAIEKYFYQFLNVCLFSHRCPISHADAQFVRKRTVPSHIDIILVYGWAKSGHAVKRSNELHLDVKQRPIGLRRTTIQRQVSFFLSFSISFIFHVHWPQHVQNFVFFYCRRNYLQRL